MAEVTRIKKNKDGYGYKYTELSQLNEYCENNNIDYYQEIETCDINGEDYMITYVSEDGKEYKKHRGCKIVEAILSGIKNPVQEYGSSLTYCRRYSLLMALGLATEDDDGASLNGASKSKKNTTSIKTNEPELASAAQVELLEKIYKNHEDKKKELLEKYKWSSFADMPKKTASDLIKKHTAKKEEK